MKKPVNVSFENTVNPKSAFDLVRLEELFSREHIAHDPEKSHKVNFYIILLFIEGQGVHSIDFIDYKYRPGSLVTVRKDQIHKFKKEKNTKGILLLFKDEFLVSYLEEMEIQKSILVFNELLGDPKIQLNKADFDNIFDSIKRIEHEYLKVVDKHSMSIIRSELHILITKLFRIKTSKGKINIERKYLKEFVQLQSLVEKNVVKTTKVKDYALEMGLSTKTLNNITKTIINKSAKEFIDEICTIQIKRLLFKTKLSIKEIAYQSGFEETSNFYKYFKRQTSTTPEQFRAAH